MTRTRRILAAMITALEQMEPSIDIDDTLEEIVTIVRLTPEGIPRLVKVERQTVTDLTTVRKTQ